MSERWTEAWREATPPFDAERGRARLLAHVRGERPRPPRRGRTFVRIAALLAAAACVLAFVVMRWMRPAEPTLSFATDDGAGSVGAWIATPAQAEKTLHFSEGTEVVLARDSRARVERLDAHGARVVIERGALHAEVVHRTQTDWRFVAGPFEVQVTGTALRVAWDPATDKLVVDVEHGSVVVRGPHLGGERVIATGEHCEVDLGAKTSSVSEDVPLPVLDAAAPTATSSHDVRPSPVAPPSWTSFEERGDYEGAYAAANRTGLASLYASSSADDLIRLAQVGQLTGHSAVEREALLACRRRFPGSLSASVAAYQLARSSPPSEAATWLSTYLAEQPNGPLAREASGRLIETYSLAGDDRAARDAARTYLARYPDGPHAAVAHRVLASSKDE
jgi:hypothetical protein